MTRREEEAKRRGDTYYLPPGVAGPDPEYLPRVTSILAEVAKPALLRWAARTAAQYALAHPGATVDEAAAAPWRDRDTAASTGTTIHTWAEALARGVALDLRRVPSAYRGYAQAVRAWWDATVAESLHAEAMVASVRYGYAGTLDAVVRTHSGEVVLVDIKKRSPSGYLPEWEWSLQLSAYLHADLLVDPRDRTQILTLPPIDSAAVVTVAADGTYGWHPMPDRFAEFLAYLHVYYRRAGKVCREACWCHGRTE